MASHPRYISARDNFIRCFRPRHSPMLARLTSERAAAADTLQRCPPPPACRAFRQRFHHYGHYVIAASAMAGY